MKIFVSLALDDTTKINLGFNETLQTAQHQRKQPNGAFTIKNTKSMFFEYSKYMCFFYAETYILFLPHS